MNERIFIFFVALIESGLTVEIEGFSSEPQGICFTLPALYCHLFDDDEIQYKRFRSMLYEGDLNQRLAERKARVGMWLSSRKVDTSVYYLYKI